MIRLWLHTKLPEYLGDLLLLRLLWLLTLTFGKFGKSLERRRRRRIEELLTFENQDQKYPAKDCPKSPKSSYFSAAVVAAGAVGYKMTAT